MDRDREAERIVERFFGIIFYVFVQALIVCFVGILITSTLGCDRPYLPWNAGPRWGTSGHERPAVVNEEPTVPQRRIEDFCRDERATVESYRRWLASEEPWSSSPDVDERRRNYTQQFIDQFDRECN